MWRKDEFGGFKVIIENISCASRKATITFDFCELVELRKAMRFVSEEKGSSDPGLFYDVCTGLIVASALSRYGRLDEVDFNEVAECQRKAYESDE